MGFMTAQEYIESLRKLKTVVYLFGERVENFVDHPVIRPSINSVAMTYALAQNPEYQEIMTAVSNLTGERILPHSSEYRRSDKQGENAKASGREDRSMFPALRGYGCFQCHLLHHI